MKRKRSKKESSGARKVRADKGISKRRGKVVEGDIGYIKNPNRWPSEDQLVKYAEMNQEKKPRGGSRRKKPMDVFFPLLEQAVGDNQPHKAKTVGYLLTCAALKVARVRRYPGWITQRTYDLKNQVLDLS